MKRIVAVAVAALVVCVALTAWAGEPDPMLEGLLASGPDALLQEADNRHNAFEDQTITVKMIMHGGANDGDALQFKTITKGENMRAIRFESPADMKGMGVVIKGRDEIYVRLPDAQKVRRVGSHAKRQSFYGSDWNFDEMSMIRLATDYTPTVKETTDTHILLDLARKEGVDLAYPKLVIRVDKSLILIDRLEYYDESDTLVKVQERTEPKKMGGEHVLYSRVVMTDIKAQHSTENQVLDETVNQQVDDGTFSRRWLVRGL